MLQRLALAAATSAGSFTLAVAVGDLHDDNGTMVGAPVEAANRLVDGLSPGSIAATASVRDLVEHDQFQFEDLAMPGQGSASVDGYLISQSEFSAEQIDATVNDLLRESATGVQLETTVLFSESSSGKMAERRLVSRLLRQSPELSRDGKVTSPAAAGRVDGLLNLITFGLLSRRSSVDAARTARARNEIDVIEAELKRLDPTATPYAAIEKYRQAASIARSAPNLEDIASRMTAAQRLVERSLYFTAPAIIEGLGGPINVRFGRLLQIGRAEAGTRADLAIGCSLVSRVGKQTQISYTDRAFRVEDIGSSNGTFVDNRLLVPGERVQLGPSTELSFGGKRNPPTKGICRMRVRVFGSDASAISLGFVTDHITRPMMAVVTEDWTSFDADVRQSWLLVTHALMIGGAKHCPIRPSVGSWPAEMASIEFSPDGYLIRPLSSIKVTLDGTHITDAMPLRRDANIKIGYLNLMFRGA
ncbi:MAG: FHA domain-containing protein [Planctomycetes bacterium]|nr:FHA domain-containing protein [Planctomycetota bacterium]